MESKESVVKQKNKSLLLYLSTTDTAALRMCLSGMAQEDKPIYRLTTHQLFHEEMSNTNTT